MEGGGGGARGQRWARGIHGIHPPRDGGSIPLYCRMIHCSISTCTHLHHNSATSNSLQHPAARGLLHHSSPTLKTHLSGTCFSLCKRDIFIYHLTPSSTHQGPEPQSPDFLYIHSNAPVYASHSCPVLSPGGIPWRDMLGHPSQHSTGKTPQGKVQTPP